MSNEVQIIDLTHDDDVIKEQNVFIGEQVNQEKENVGRKRIRCTARMSTGGGARDYERKMRLEDRLKNKSAIMLRDMKYDADNELSFDEESSQEDGQDVNKHQQGFPPAGKKQKF